jgi:hypothetical protein
MTQVTEIFSFNVIYLKKMIKTLQTCFPCFVDKIFVFGLQPSLMQFTGVFTGKFDWFTERKPHLNNLGKNSLYYA